MVGNFLDLEVWIIGLWNILELEYWIIGVLEYWNWSIGLLELLAD